MNTESYWDESGLLKARKHERDGNMLSRTAYYHLFGGKIDVTSSANIALLYMNSMGKFYQHPYTKTDKASHDEMTAVFYFASLHDRGNSWHIKTAQVWRYLIYPQVFFFLLACKYKWQWAIHASYIQMMRSTAHIEKAANGKWDTDGSLLSFLKIKAFDNLKIGNPLKSYRVEKNIKLNWASKKGFDQFQSARKNLINEMLSEEPEHPLMELVNGK